MSPVAESLVDQAQAIEHAHAVPGVSGLYGIESGGRSFQIDQAQLDEIRKRFGAALDTGLRRVQATIAGGTTGHADAALLRDDQWFVSRVSEHMPHGKAILAAALLPGIGTAILADDIAKVSKEREFPDQLIWVEPSEAIGRVRKALAGGKLVDAATEFSHAEASAAKAYHALLQYRQGVEEGAGSAIETLEITRDVSFATAGIIATVATGGAAGAVIGAGITATGAAAQQAMEVHLDMRKEIDWAGISFDAVIGIVTSKLGGKLGGLVAGKVMGNPAVAGLSRKAVATLVNDLISGEASTFLQTTARALFDDLRGARSAMSMDGYLHALSEQLTDPKSIFMNLLTGEAARRLHVATSKPGAGRGGKGGPPRLEPEAPTKIVESGTPAPGQEKALPPSAEPPQLEPAPPPQAAEPPVHEEPPPPAPQFIDPAAQAAGVSRPEFAGVGTVFESTFEGPSGMETEQTRAPQREGVDFTPASAEPSGLELAPAHHPEGFAPPHEQGMVELQPSTEPMPELGPVEHGQGFGAEPELGLKELAPAAEATPELGPTEHPGGFGGEVDARERALEHQGPANLEALDPSLKKNRMWTPPDPEKARERRLKEWREYNQKRRELQQVNPDWAPERPDAAGYEELKRPLKVPGVEERPEVFGAESGELVGTEHRTDVSFHELNAAEIVRELRVDIDQGSGQVKRIRYRIDAQSVPEGKPVSDRSFKEDPTVRAAQTEDAAYKEANAARRAAGLKPLNRGHLAQREAFKVKADQALLAERGIEGKSVGRLDAFRNTPEALAAADQWTNVVPMTEELNQGKAWRDAENRSLELADQHGFVYVEIVPEYGPAPKRMPRGGAPIPERFRRIVTGPNGVVLDPGNQPYENK